MKINVWDHATRIFHWALVINVVLAWYTIENRMIDWHEISGHSLLSLLIFRCVWGIWGTSTARFSQFIAHPKKALQYLRASLKMRANHSTGHNPAGGWMVVIMLLVLAFQVVSGMLANDDLGFSGALSDEVSKGTSDWFTYLHGLNFNLILLIVWLHLVAVFFYVLVKRDNLIKAMVTGTKPLSQVDPQDAVVLRSQRMALLCFMLSLAFALLLFFSR